MSVGERALVEEENADRDGLAELLAKRAAKQFEPSPAMLVKERLRSRWAGIIWAVIKNDEWYQAMDMQWRRKGERP